MCEGWDMCEKIVDKKRKVWLVLLSTLLKGLGVQYV